MYIYILYYIYPPFFSVAKGPNEAVTCNLEVKHIVTMAKGDKTFIWILTLTINEKQC